MEKDNEIKYKYFDNLINYTSKSNVILSNLYINELNNLYEIKNKEFCNKNVFIEKSSTSKCVSKSAINKSLFKRTNCNCIRRSNKNFFINSKDFEIHKLKKKLLSLKSKKVLLVKCSECKNTKEISISI